MLMNISVSNLKFLCLIVGLISYTSPAYAYLDPGTGSIILTFLIGIVSGIVAFFRTIKYKIMSIFKKDIKKENNEIANPKNDINENGE